ncbi:spore gernimation protein GerPD [Paenibacillus thermotolerans]|uniref:spore gernimation protein GerPD n=1 Tax=Paenibacillus thermotolerans TaxID=3027807 RepID=UPI002367C545|nr:MULTISPECIES: spore gernimation protein GerPD [unclassified Paenibacillus]
MIRQAPAIQVINRQLQVNHIRIIGVASSAVVLVGDTRSINCSSIFDTPPESLIVGPLVPFVT